MQKRLPDFRAVLQVYAVIAVIFSGWTLTAFLWRLSAWLLLLNLGEIFTIFSYAMAANLLESLIVLLVLLAACVLLPARALRDDFEVRGAILAAGLIGAMQAFVSFQMQFGIEIGLRLLIPPLVILVLTAFLLILASKISSVRSIVLWLSDRLVVFLFVLVPLFLILSAYVIVRNIT